MALDATVGGASANSYLTVEEADALAAADYGPEVSTWLSVGAEAKGQVLMRATREIDGYLRTGWPPYATDQALLFPRAIDVTGSPAAPYLPRTLKLATYEQATYLLRNAAVIDQAAARRARDLQSASEPNVAYTRPSGGQDAPVLAPGAAHYLAGYRSSATSRGVRSVRMASGHVW